MQCPILGRLFAGASATAWGKYLGSNWVRILSGTPASFPYNDVRDTSLPGKLERGGGGVGGGGSCAIPDGGFVDGEVRGGIRELEFIVSVDGMEILSSISSWPEPLDPPVLLYLKAKLESSQ